MFGYGGRVITESRIAEVARALADASDSATRVIVFGSHGRGNPAADSDIDLLVIQRDVPSRFRESARLGRIAADMRVPADVVVVSEDQVEEWGDVEGAFLHDALREGRVVAES